MQQVKIDIVELTPFLNAFQIFCHESVTILIYHHLLKSLLCILHILVSANCLPSSQAKLGTTKREISQRYEVKANSQCCQNPYEISAKVEKIIKNSLDWIPSPSPDPAFSENSNYGWESLLEV